MSSLLMYLVALVVFVVLFPIALECLARLFFKQIDYFVPILVEDDILTHRCEGGWRGLDDWGFRNPSVPERADIVCIGDSMTFGLYAPANRTWPAVLAEIRGESVYNMGLGGYGPVHYLHLMRTLAVKLHPKIVIVGFYFGNDLLDAYNIVLSNKNWTCYKDLLGRDTKVQDAFVFPPFRRKSFDSIRSWLSKNSLFYVVVAGSPIFESFRERQLRLQMANQSGRMFEYRDDKHDVIFNLVSRSRFLDMSDPRIKAAMEITKRVMLDLRDFGQKESIRLILALIPTKERVYGDILKRAGYADRHIEIAEALRQEDDVRSLLTIFLRQNNFDFVDLLPKLSTAADERDLFPKTNSHPNVSGYRAIAQILNAHINHVTEWPC